MARKQGGNDVQRLLENGPVSGGIQILPTAGDRAPDLCDSLFNFEHFNFELLKFQLLGCADRGVYQIELIGLATMIQIYHALRPCLIIANLYIWFIVTFIFPR